MDIKISHDWLLDYLKTNAKPEKIAYALSLCGPSVEKIDYINGVYNMEITTNRIDLAGVYGVAREASAILPEFNIKCNFIQIVTKLNIPKAKKVNYLQAKVDPSLCLRFMAVKISGVKLAPSPNYIQKRLTNIGVRPINNVVDISNYIMHALGQPVHTFDYDKIKGAKMILRSSKRGEDITTLDGKKHSLPGGDIVIEDGNGRLIDLAGVMGGKNSAIDEGTTNVLLFVQTYNPFAIRKTSMSLSHRTEAASIFEKGLDTELVEPAMNMAIELFVKLTHGKPESKVLDIYPNPYKQKVIYMSKDFLSTRLGVVLSKEIISKYLEGLGFKTKWSLDTLSAYVPSFRSADINIPEDILEEVARIYGYHNIPSKLMKGGIPQASFEDTFKFENQLKDILTGCGGNEIYSLSLVPVNYVEANSLEIRNPLGTDTAYLRSSLKPSLISAAYENKGWGSPFHIFEISNVYLPVKGDLPKEKMILAGIFSDYEYRQSKGIIETLLTRLNINAGFISEDGAGFKPSQRIKITHQKSVIGEFGVFENNFIYYEFEVDTLRKFKKVSSYTPLPKYPAQIEDINLTLPYKTKVGEILSLIQSFRNVSDAKLFDIYKDKYTFRIWFQNPSKTLTDAEVSDIRKSLLKAIESKFASLVG